MSIPILATKLHIPHLRPELVHRHRLIEQMNEGIQRKLVLLSATAGSGKTTLTSEWVSSWNQPVAWLSLDEGDKNPVRFLEYIIAALQTILPDICMGISGLLQSPQQLPMESILTMLLNELNLVKDDFALVLDDYHVLDSRQADDAVAFLLEHLPPKMHLVIATREDPNLPLARLRARGHLTELRAAELRFTPSEAATFLNEGMGLKLSKEDITALEARTEGWIAGLQLAALSMQGQKKPDDFIQSFTGSHHFVLDYLMEEILGKQPEYIQTFLLLTSILDRMCGSLCDSILQAPFVSGQDTLEYLERSNLFIIPLDNERKWYRYHHLFTDLLRKRLQQSTSSAFQKSGCNVEELHRCASSWYEDHEMDLEAFHHAVSAKDLDNAARLLEGEGMPLHFRGAVAPVLSWLESLPKAELDARPSLWVMYASALSMTGNMACVEEKLQAAEAALHENEEDDRARNLIGHIAAIRALLAVAQNQIEVILTQSQRALKYLHPENISVRTATIWKMGLAYQLKGDRTAAGRAFAEAIAAGEASGNHIIIISARSGLGGIQEVENQLNSAAGTYRIVLQMAGNMPQPPVCDAHLGLARIYYQWNNLEAAGQHWQESIKIARQLKNNDRIAACQLFLARLKLAENDFTGVAVILEEVALMVKQHNLVLLTHEVAALQVITFLRRGNKEAAAEIAKTQDLPISRARVYLAQSDANKALAELETLRCQAEAKGWADVRLKVMVLQAVAFYNCGKADKAIQMLGNAMTLAETDGFIRIFIDEGAPMSGLLLESAALGIKYEYTGKLLAAFNNPKDRNEQKPSPGNTKPLIEPLSQRELEILRLISYGLSNHEISKKLFIAMDTVKGHNRRIFDKLQVHRRTEAVARAREMDLL